MNLMEWTSAPYLLLLLHFSCLQGAGSMSQGSCKLHKPNDAGLCTRRRSRGKLLTSSLLPTYPVAAVAEAIASWTKLRRFAFPRHLHHRTTPAQAENRVRSFSKSLRSLTKRGSDHRNSSFIFTIISVFFRICRLKDIC